VTGRFVVESLHDPFDLACPVCGCRSWERDGSDVKCCDCAAEIRVLEDAAQCRIVLEVQGA